MTLKKLLTFALLVLLVVLASILGRTAFGEDGKLDFVAGNLETIEAAKDGNGTIICSDEKNALSLFSTKLGVDVPKYRYYSLNVARGTYQHARERYRDAALGVTYRDDIPDGHVASFCVAFNATWTPARKAELVAPVPYQKKPTSDASPTSALERRNDREASEVVTEPENVSSLTRWNSALAELRRIARHVASNRSVSRTDIATMKDGLQGVRDILDENDSSDTFMESSSHVWNAALTELRAAATELAEMELSKSIRSAMKADLKDVEDSLNRKKPKKKFGVF